MEQVAQCCKAALALVLICDYCDFMMKSLFRNALVREILARCLALYMYLVRKTTKWEIIGASNLQDNIAFDKGIVACLWHSRIIMIPSVFDLDKYRVSMLFSLSKDGDITTRVGELMGYDIIRGSTAKKREETMEDKGGIAAFRAMISAIKKGNIVALTPDGPSGPPLKMTFGAIRTAKAANTIFLPIAASVRKSTLANSWDRLVLPPLFNKGVIIFGNPITIDAKNEADLEEIRAQCEAVLNKVTFEADSMCGIELVQNTGESENHV